jgi:hypothetical protein
MRRLRGLVYRRPPAGEEENLKRVREALSEWTGTVLTASGSPQTTTSLARTVGEAIQNTRATGVRNLIVLDLVAGGDQAAVKASLVDVASSAVTKVRQERLTEDSLLSVMDGGASLIQSCATGMKFRGEVPRISPSTPCPHGFSMISAERT